MVWRVLPWARGWSGAWVVGVSLFSQAARADLFQRFGDAPEVVLIPEASPIVSEPLFAEGSHASVPEALDMPGVAASPGILVTPPRENVMGSVKFINSWSSLELSNKKGVSSSHLMGQQSWNSVDQIVERVFAEDSSCQQVFTGNKGGNASVTQGYAKVMAYSFASDLCQPMSERRGAVLHKPVAAQYPWEGRMHLDTWSEGDALAINEFRSGFVADKRSDENLVPLYSLLYTLGMRESPGDFAEGRDLNARNTKPESAEAGPFQVSANSFELWKVASGSESNNPLTETFHTYVAALQQASNNQQRMAFCGTSLLKGDPKNDTDASAFDPTGAKLEEGITKGPCARASSSSKGKGSSSGGLYMPSNPDYVRPTREVSLCFQFLNQQCPFFATRYAATLVRIRRQHNGPLYTKDELRVLKKQQQKRGMKAQNLKAFDKPALKPACQKLFKELYSSRGAICAEQGL